MNKLTAQVLVIIASAVICGALIIITKGEHGIGWFIISLLIIAAS